MAKRPVFIPVIKDTPLVKELFLDFDWNPGFSITQKQKNISALHSKARSEGYFPVLEISTKSLELLGKNLSAFNLQLTINESSASVESFYQSSKVFEFGGPYLDLLNKDGREIKQDLRLQKSGDLLRFQLFDDIWDLSPLTAFYDWLYINALYQNPSLGQQLLEYKGFTDIEFNPKKSFSCQARSAALFVSLVKREQLGTVIKDKTKFLSLYYKDVGEKNNPQQFLPFINSTDQ